MECRQRGLRPSSAVVAIVLASLHLTWSLHHEVTPEGYVKGTGSTIGIGELEEEWRGEILQISWSPRVIYLKNFLSDAECDHLIQKATPRMVKSMVVDSATGKSKASEVRTSTGTFFSKGDDEVIAVIDKRVASVSMIPTTHQEGMQILHYQNGQKYSAHNDYFHDSVNAAPSNGGQRVVTVLMYLTTPEEGGETVFPEADRKTWVTGPNWSDCAKEGFAVKAKRGDAVMFYSLHPDGSLDPASLHGSCPTLKGDKWSATKWIHVLPFGPGVNDRKKGDCEDDNEACPEWAYQGECEKNPTYMLNSCKRSCKVCTPKKNAS